VGIIDASASGIIVESSSRRSLMKKRLGPVERLYPMPCPLVVGGDMDDAGVLAVAWINVVSSAPPTVAMGLRESRHTLQLIRSSGSFTVNVPPASLVAAVDFCGLATGHKTADKIASAGLTLAPSAQVAAPLIEQCPFNLECRVTEEVEVGSYRVVLGEIVEAHADESVLVSADSDLVDMDKLDPLVYIAGVREYRRLGDKVGDAFSVGRSLMHSEDE
jgi:flavin reductase (DIM6/NTAB) family NADH-FMN oxidoreductase RutF